MSRHRDKDPKFLTTEYSIWSNMRRRCTLKSLRSYADYGGRGIKVCKRWNSFKAFLKDMGPRPGSQYTLNRKHNDRDYKPSNCNWATWDEQGNNKRNNRRITWNGKTQTLTQWARELGLSRKMLSARIALGWSGDRLFSPKLTKWNARLGPTERVITFRRMAKTIPQWAEYLHADARTLRRRLQSGWSERDTLSRPIRKVTPWGARRKAA